MKQPHSPAATSTYVHCRACPSSANAFNKKSYAATFARLCLSSSSNKTAPFCRWALLCIPLPTIPTLVPDPGIIKPRASKFRPTSCVLTPVRNVAIGAYSAPLHTQYDLIASGPSLKSANQLLVRKAVITTPSSASVWHGMEGTHPGTLSVVENCAATQASHKHAAIPSASTHAKPWSAPGHRACALVRVCAMIGPHDVAQSAAGCCGPSTTVPTSHWRANHCRHRRCHRPAPPHRAARHDPGRSPQRGRGRSRGRRPR